MALHSAIKGKLISVIGDEVSNIIIKTCYHFIHIICNGFDPTINS